MKNLFGLLCVAFSLLAGTAYASPSSPVAGADYTVLPTPQPVDVPRGKIAVTEFFWYGCPHCNELQSYLEPWIAAQKSDIVFRRVPVTFRDDFIPHSKMFHALEALGVERKLTPAIFREIHVNGNYLLTPEAQAKFLQTQGVDPGKFMAAYNSFSTQSALQRDKAMMSSYRISLVPTIVVAGKYETGPPAVHSWPDMISVVNFLVSQVRAGKM
jgi:protein dithiol oxidoreductase (disulfide-forming)